MDLVNHWALFAAAFVAVAAAVCQMALQRVPNVLTLPALSAALLVAAMLNLGVEIPTGGGGLGAALVAAAVSLVGTLPFYARHGLGAGCVKAQMAFGAWVGCALTWSEALFVAIVGVIAANALTWLGIYLWLALKREGSLFPAQITFTLGALAAVLYHCALGTF